MASNSKSNSNVFAAIENDRILRLTDWKVSDAIDIDDADITFDGQPLSAHFEQARYSLKYQEERNEKSKHHQRGRKPRRE